MEQLTQYCTREEEATKRREEMKNEHIGRFKYFLSRKINTVCEFSGTRNAVLIMYKMETRAILWKNAVKSYGGLQKRYGGVP